MKDDYGNSKPNPKFLREHFFREGRLTEGQALFILEHTTTVLTQEPNMVDVKSPVTSELAQMSRNDFNSKCLQYVETFMVNTCVQLHIRYDFFALIASREISMT